MNHGHNDIRGEWFAMPSEPCVRCKAECCIECSTARVLFRLVNGERRREAVRLCETCDWWRSLSEKERAEASR